MGRILRVIALAAAVSSCGVAKEGTYQADFSWEPDCSTEHGRILNSFRPGSEWTVSIEEGVLSASTGGCNLSASPWFGSYSIRTGTCLQLISNADRIADPDNPRDFRLLAETFQCDPVFNEGSVTPEAQGLRFETGGVISCLHTTEHLDAPTTTETFDCHFRYEGLARPK